MTISKSTISPIITLLTASGSESNEDNQNPNTNVFIAISVIALVIYAALSFICVYSFFKSIYKKESHTLSKIFHIFLFVYTTTRIIWYGLRVLTGEGPITFFLNNISFPFYMTGLLVVLFFWWERYHSTYVSTNEFLPKYKLSFILLTVLMFLIQIILIILFYSVDHQKREGGTVYLINTLYQCFISLLIGISFLFIVLRIYLKFTSIDKDVCRNQINQVRKICLLSIGFSCCFLIRTVIFFYNPITHKYINYEVFITFGYFIPDIIPTLIQLSIIHSNMKSEQEDNTYINMLYEEENDNDLDDSNGMASYSLNESYYGDGNGDDNYSTQQNNNNNNNNNNSHIIINDNNNNRNKNIITLGDDINNSNNNNSIYYNYNSTTIGNSFDNSFVYSPSRNNSNSNNNNNNNNSNNNNSNNNNNSFNPNEASYLLS